jgi:hypothetical protein
MTIYLGLFPFCNLPVTTSYLWPQNNQIGTVGTRTILPGLVLEDKLRSVRPKYVTTQSLSRNLNRVAKGDGSRRYTAVVSNSSDSGTFFHVPSHVL